MRGGTENRELQRRDVMLKMNRDGREYIEYKGRQTNRRTDKYNNS